MTRTINVASPVMAENDRLADALRRQFALDGTLCLNLVSAPGAGKTTLLERTLDAASDTRVAVLTGDLATDNDARRLSRYGHPVRQLVTDGACHLDAQRVARARAELPEALEVLFIENVGNLVCPSSWDLGEALRVVLFSVTEGEDKPLKYPSTFVKADLVLLTKIDLLPYVPFDVERAVSFVARQNPMASLIRLSALTGEGLPEWLTWVAARRVDASPHP